MLYANCEKIETINEILDIRETKEKLKLISDSNSILQDKLQDIELSLKVARSSLVEGQSNEKQLYSHRR